jgi:hypothetical protein
MTNAMQTGTAVETKARKRKKGVSTLLRELAVEGARR